MYEIFKNKIIYIFGALVGVLISYNTVHGDGTYQQHTLLFFQIFHFTISVRPLLGPLSGIRVGV
jgi:hypothetical protein